MRIAYVCADSGVPVFGKKGCSIHAQEIIRAFRRRDANVELFTSRVDGEPPTDLLNIPLFALPKAPKGDTELREKAAREANSALRLLLEKAGRFELIYERYSLWSFAAMEFAREMNVPGILEVNAPLVEEQSEHRGLINRAEAERIRGKVFQDARAIVAVSTQVAEYVGGFLQDFPREKEKIHVVPNGVDPARFPVKLPPNLPAKSETFTVGFVGTLKPWHGLEYLVEAFARLYENNKKYRLLIVGDGPERERVEQNLREKSLTSVVHFTGAVEPDEIPGWLASMDAAVAPYPAGENFYFSPLKVYEYMAARLPVVASRIGQLENVIEDGVNGLLVPPGDAQAIARALEQLRGNAELRNRLGEAARETVVEKHTWEAVAHRILEFANLDESEKLSGVNLKKRAEVAG